MSTQRLFSVKDDDREVANLSILTGAVLEWNEDRSKRTVFQVVPTLDGGWKQIRQITTDELLGALRRDPQNVETA